MDLISRLIVKKRFLNKAFRFLHPKILKIKLQKNISMFIDPSDISGPSFYVAYSGEPAFYHYEIPVKAAILKYLPANGIFFDVGANIGLISLFIAKFRPDVTIKSFEPSDITSQCLSATINEWNIKNITVIKKGVSNLTKDNHTFFIDGRSSGGDSLEVTAVSSVAKKVQISLTTIDDYVLTNNIIPDLIKIDVQDHERFVLLGAQNTIQNHHPTLVVETNNKILLENYDEIIACFKGYQVASVESIEFLPVESWKVLALKMLEKNIITFDYVLKF